MTDTGWIILDQAITNVGKTLPDLTYEIERIARERYGSSWWYYLDRMGLGYVSDVIKEAGAIQ